MKIEFTGRQTEVSDELRQIAERKLQKLTKILPAVIRAHVILTTEKHRQVAEVSVHSRGSDLTAAEVSTAPALAIAGAVEKLLRQAQRRRTKRVRKGAPSPRRSAAPAAESSAERLPRVIRSRRTAAKPMTIEEAALELEARADGVVVFREASTERVAVLFRRSDGNLGLVEPEA